MLGEFERIEQTFGVEKAADLRKACRYLIRNQFAYSGDRGVAIVYNTLTDNRFRPVVDAFFDSLGYRIQRNADEQWVGIILDDDDPGSTPKLRIEETIVVLVLGAHWQEEADVGALVDRAVAVTSLNILHDRYKDMIANAGKVAMPVGRFLDVLREVAARNLVWIGDYDGDANDREVEIRPMIKLVSGASELDRLEAYVKLEEVGARSRAQSAAVADGAGGVEAGGTAA